MASLAIRSREARSAALVAVLCAAEGQAAKRSSAAALRKGFDRQFTVSLLSST
jgi:hypothetical protein